MKQTLLLFACVLTSLALPAQENGEEQSGYLPFVETGKKWHVVSNVTNPYAPSRLERFEMTDEVVHDGKTYVHTYQLDDELATYRETGLFREENRRVYKYEAGKDVMMYDFSLKEGDTFTYEFGLDQPMNCKVLKQGWLYTSPRIVSSRTVIDTDTVNIKYRLLRTWTIGSDNGSGGYNEFTTWIECIGALRNMFSYPDTEGELSCLAYIERVEDEANYLGNEYLPFPFSNTYGPVHGCNLPIDVRYSGEGEWGRHDLTYELEGDRLHVFGKAFTQCSNNYAYFYEKETDDPLVHTIEFVIQEAEPLVDCMAHHYTNFFVHGFDPNITYTVVDNHGEEHPVINRTPQTAYRPFIEDKKVWIVKVYPDDYGTRNSRDPWTEYCYFDGDTIVDGQACKQMKYVTDANEENWVNGSFTPGSLPPVYMGACYEKDQKVYFAFDKQQHLELLYDFTISPSDSVIGTDGTLVLIDKLSGGITGFKGTYYNLYYADGMERWFEGVGSVSWPWRNHPLGITEGSSILLSCIVGDEVIYYNSDEAYPYILRDNANARRFDFTHTVKTKPQAPMRKAPEQSTLYGEYNEVQLGINLNPLDDAYLVHITDESGNIIYKKTVNAGNIVALDIDISTYAKGSYTVTVENSQESFSGKFDVQTAGIEETRMMRDETKTQIYNLQGQRRASLQRGLNIVNGHKVYIE